MKTIKEDTWDDKVATTIDGIKDSGKGCTTGSMDKDVVAGHFHLVLNMAGRHHSSSDTGG